MSTYSHACSINESPLSSRFVSSTYANHIFSAAALVSSKAVGAVWRAFEAVGDDVRVSGARPCRCWPAASSCGSQVASPALLSAELAGCLGVVGLRVSRAAVSRLLRAAFSGLLGGSRVSSSSLVTLRGAVAWSCGRWGSRVARASRCGGWREVPARGATPRFAGLEGQICFGRESLGDSPIGPRVSSIGSSASQLPRARAVAPFVA